MENVSTDSKTITWPVLKGTTAKITINNLSGWDPYDEIVMEIKSRVNVNADPILRLIIGEGLSIDGARLFIELNYDQTTVLRPGTLYSDIKLRIGTEVLNPIPFIIIVTDTVTDITTPVP